MMSDLEKILSTKTGMGSMKRIGLSPDGLEEIQWFCHATAIGSLMERYKYSQVFGKPLPRHVQRYHPLIIAKLCRYAREVGIDVEGLLVMVDKNGARARG
jgi:hypothetical protein